MKAEEQFLKELKDLCTKFDVSISDCAEYDGAERYCGKSFWFENGKQGNERICIDIDESLI